MHQNEHFKGVTSKKAIRDESYIERVLWMKLPLFLKRKSWMLLATSSATTPLLVVDVASRRRRRNNTKAMTTSSSSSFQMGRDTLRVDFELHRENRLRLAQAMEEKINAEKKKTKKERNLVLVESGKQTQRYGTDNEPLFRQESYFHWMFGCRESDCFGALDVEKKKAILSLGYRTSTSFGWGNRSRTRS
jgi:hypothetical protein